MNVRLTRYNAIPDKTALRLSSSLNSFDISVSKTDKLVCGFVNCKVPDKELHEKKEAETSKAD
jgi:hypothetical protein